MAKKVVQKKGDSVVKKNDPFMEFLLGQVGGKQAAYRAFAIERLNKMLKTTTLRDVFNQADEEGWGEILRSLTLGEIRGEKSGTRRKRAPAGQLKRQILEQFETKKDLHTLASLALALGSERKRISRALVELVANKQLKREGTKRNSEYSLP